MELILNNLTIIKIKIKELLTIQVANISRKKMQSINKRNIIDNLVTFSFQQPYKNQSTNRMHTDLMLSLLYKLQMDQQPWRHNKSC